MKTAAVIGFGCAGFCAAKAIREAEPERVIDIYSDTDEAPYNPMLTTYYVSGKISESAMFPFGDLEQVRSALGANIFCSSPVAALKARERKIVLRDGTERQYDDIIIATGASAVIPPIKNLPERGIYKMRTAQDARALTEALAGQVGSALVVGAQMVGIKVVELLHRRGVKTYLADMESRMFPASAYDTTAAIIAERLLSAGIELRLGAAVQSVAEQQGGGLLSTLSDGSTVASDIVVFCSGIRANLGFVDRSELDVGRGIRTDLHMRTSAEHVYAAGDCCETTNILTGEPINLGLWANAAQQGRTAGRNAAGLDEEYQGNLIQNITHYMDTDFISVGDVKAAGERAAWSSGSGWRIEVTVADGKMVALNILDNANIAGPVKNIILHQAAHPSEKMTDYAKMLLTASGMPKDFIAMLGGEGID
ncbi:MAG: FAD-dependent oxidoreductase [Oscillospiraceae bacterium]|nr:FAD-dependent oxidoreductase [Oscillospiraceae bacterium]